MEQPESDAPYRGADRTQPARADYNEPSACLSRPQREYLGRLALSHFVFDRSFEILRHLSRRVDHLLADIAARVPEILEPRVSVHLPRNVEHVHHPNRLIGPADVAGQPNGFSRGFRAVVADDDHSVGQIPVSLSGDVGLILIASSHPDGTMTARPSRLP